MIKVLINNNDGLVLVWFIGLFLLTINLDNKKWYVWLLYGKRLTYDDGFGDLMSTTIADKIKAHDCYIGQAIMDITTDGKGGKIIGGYQQNVKYLDSDIFTDDYGHYMAVNNMLSDYVATSMDNDVIYLIVDDSDGISRLVSVQPMYVSTGNDNGLYSVFIQAGNGLGDVVYDNTAIDDIVDNIKATLDYK